MERRLRERGSIGGSLLAVVALAWGCTTPNDGAGGAGATSGTSGSLASNASTGAQPQPLDVFTDAYPNLQLEIDYATGAEPYTGNLIGFGDIWDIFKANALRLFEGRGKALSVPTELAQMEELTDVTATGFTTDDIFAIVARHRDAPSAPPTATFYVLYLNGVYVEDGKENPGVLGINFGGTGVIAMFKPVIESTSAGPGLNRLCQPEAAKRRRVA